MEINFITKKTQPFNPPQGPYDAELMKTSNQFITILKNLENSNNWKLKEETQNMTVYEMEVDSRVAAKGTRIINLPYQTIFNFLADPSFVKTVSDVCQMFQVMYDNSVVRVVHFIMRFPGPVSDREIVAVNTVRVEGNSKAYIGNRSCKYPFQKHPDTVVANAHVSGFILQRLDGSRTRVTSISDIDPEGMIPSFVKNAVATKRVQFLATLQQKIKSK